jgi:6-phospho-beta-glucosidase
MKARLVILGGSSPFTVALVNALTAVCDRLPAYDLVLHGRNETNLALVTQYARHQLQRWGWRVLPTLRMEQALTEATVVIHQIRYGGMEGRAVGEDFCARYDVAADETLGPAALLCGIRLFADLQSTCGMLKQYCPEAWVLNLTNPLSSVTAAMIEAGIQRGIGLCELPWVTLQEAAHLLHLPADALEWGYAGFNHRGFIHTLQYQGNDLMPALLHCLGERTIGGITAAAIEHLRAIPLKYFRLLDHQSSLASRRATYLMQIREQILAELRASCAVAPPSLQQRYLEWYPQSVVPMLLALHAPEPSVHIVNVVRDDGIVWESKAQVCRKSIQVLDQPTDNCQVATWLSIFQKHERAFLDAIQDPTAERILEAFIADPTVPDERVESLTRALWKACC